METASEYLARTESAMQHLFQGIASYLRVLEAIRGVVFVTGTPEGPERDAEFAEWFSENSARLAAARDAELRFVAESFALDTLCGSVLHVAEKALELYSDNALVPTEFAAVVKGKAARFCVGRLVRGVPLGLVIHVARNQHAHHEEPPREPGLTVFRRLAKVEASHRTPQYCDPAFDIDNPKLVSYASNVTALVEWRSYESYLTDMRAMLKV